MGSPGKLSITGRFITRLEQLRTEIDASQNPGLQIWAELQTAQEVLEGMRKSNPDDTDIKECENAIDELMALYEAKRATCISE